MDNNRNTPTAGGIRFTVGSGNKRFQFSRAEMHTADWDRQKVGFRQVLGLPAHGHKAQ